MHECPECGQVCYCDLDDSNDCRDDGECLHGCEPEHDEYGDEADCSGKPHDSAIEPHDCPGTGDRDA